MRLYTVQSLEVAAYLKEYSIYFPDFEKCDLLQDPEDREYFEECYKWMIHKYNELKGHDFSSAPVWWYTDIKELMENYKHIKLTEIVMQAEVPDNWILRYDANLYERGPFCRMHIGWAGHRLELSDTWTKADDDLFDKIWDAYKDNLPAMIETWNEIFNIQKSKSVRQRIHCITPFIDLAWMQIKK
ncbi:MAG: hypothetical protein ACYDEX_24750 [Mobilitalea sp.]